MAQSCPSITISSVIASIPYSYIATILELTTTLQRQIKYLPGVHPLGWTIKAVCAEWPAYGYRRVTAELHGEGRIVNHKKVMRLMKENGLTVRPRRRFVATTDSDHDGPIFP